MSPVRCLLAATIAATLAACSPAPQSAPAAPAKPAAPATAPAPAASAPAAAASTGLDLGAVDHAVRPGDNFYEYANGNWQKTAEIPADRASIGSFYTVFKRTQNNLTQLIKDAAASNAAPGSDSRKIADFYNAYMDTAAIDAHGLAPIQGELDTIKATASRDDLARVLGAGLRQDVDPINATDFHTANLFGLFVAQGLEDPSHNIAYLLQGGTVLPNRDYYLSSDPTMVDVRSKYQAYMTALLKQAGYKDADAMAKAAFALETDIAKVQASLVDSEDVHKANNPWALADFAKKAPGLDWAAYFKAAGLDNQKVIDAWQPAAITGLSRLVASAPLPAWRALLTFHALDAAAPLLPKAYADLSFDFHGKTMQGTTAERPREERAVDATGTALGMTVGKLYVAKYFPPEAKQAAEAMAANLIAAFKARLDTLEWMTPATRQQAAAKLDSLKVQVGYPDQWPSTDGLVITADDPLTNDRNVSRFNYQQRLKVLGQPVNHDHWWMTPQLVNAINLPLENELQFPAAILQPPFFDPKADAAHNYGAIGAVIGHEISHSFDNMGSQFDAEGRMHNWWTPEDAKHFAAATDRLAKQFDQYEALPGLRIDGKQTLGENIADVSGLTIAYLAYHKSLDGKPAPVIDGLTGDQRFFLAFAQAWQTKMRDAALRQRVKTDVHAPGQFRAETVRNLDAWYAAFNVQPGEKLYLAPDQRVKIW